MRTAAVRAAIFGAQVLAEVTALAIVGNLIGRVGLVTLSHAAQALGSKNRD